MKFNSKFKIAILLISVFLLASILPTEALLLPSDQQNTNQPILNNFLNQGQQINQQVNKVLNQNSFNTNPNINSNYNDFLLNLEKYTQTFLSNPLWYGIYSVLKEIVTLVGQLLIWVLSEAINVINFLLSKL